MTIVLFVSSGGGGVPGGGGCGTAASSPFGVNGVIVIKITSSTSKISMNGVTLISALAEIFFFTFFIVVPPTCGPDRQCAPSTNQSGQHQHSGCYRQQRRHRRTSHEGRS